MHKYSKEEIIREAKRADDKTDEPLTLKDFVRISGIKEWRIKDMFPKGGWSELKRLAKIKKEPKSSRKLSRRNHIPKGAPLTKKKITAKEHVIAPEDIIVEEVIITEEDVVAEEIVEEKAAEEEADAKKPAKEKAAAEKAAKKEADAMKAAAEKAA